MSSKTHRPAGRLATGNRTARKEITVKAKHKDSTKRPASQALNPLALGAESTPLVCVCGLDELEKEVNKIAVNTDKVRLPQRLNLILDSLATLDNPTATAFLEHRIKTRFGLSYMEIRAYQSNVSRRREVLEREKARRSAQSASAKPKQKMTKQERREALSFLEDKRIVQRTIQDIKDMGYVGEDANKFIVYVTATSRKQRDPLSDVIKSPSAFGKSQMVKDVMRLIPPEDVLEYTRITPQALAYMLEDSLKNKWLVIMERNGSEDADYNIRVIQSEQKIRIAFPAKDPETGQIITREREVCGPIAFTETTTSPVIHLENSTRVFELYLDGSEKQTRVVHDVQRKAVTLAGLQSEKKRKAIIRRHQNAQRLLQPVRVVIPYANYISFPASHPRTRRDFPRFLAFIECVAFLRQYQKKRLTHPQTGIEYFEADLSDYKVAYEYLSPVLKQGLDELPKPSRVLLDKIRERYKDHSEEEFTRDDIRILANVNHDYVRSYVQRLEELEYLTVISGGQGKQYKYKFNSAKADDSESPLAGLTTPEELAKAIKKSRAGKRR